MSMMAAATFILLPLAASAAQQQPSPSLEVSVDRKGTIVSAKPTCDRFARTHPAQGGDAAVLIRPPSRAQRLGELPAGDLSLTVQREVNGCVEPVIVREGVGAFGERRGDR